MHIVMLGDYPGDPNKVAGGVEAVILYLLQALQRFPDLKLEVITLSRRGSYRRTAEHNNVTVHYLPRVSLPSRLSFLGNIRQMQAEIVRLKPDLVHAHIAGEYAEAAARTGLPWVLTLHGIRFLEASLRPGLLNRYRGWFIKREELHAVKLARHVISISPFVQDVFNGSLPGRVYNIENPISHAFFELPQGRQPGQLLFAGRLIRRKGVHNLLRAFAELHRRRPNATLRLAGGGTHSRAYTESYTEQLRRFVAEAGLEEAVTFLGELDEPAILEEYANCSALVLSSVLETAPMVILQAMAAGKPVVSTDAGGVRYLVEHGQTGFVVPPNDEKALAEALYQLLEDEAQSRAMGCRARELARQRFHTEAVAAKTREVYYEILGQTPPFVDKWLT
jgi:glycosyltransferase involved in cell wall biosynthesis